MTRFLRLATRITALLTLLPLTTLQAATLPVIEAQQGAVVSEQRLASAVGLPILQAGGNAVDAAVAMGYALAVVNPCCGNIGGGGFMTLHLANGKNTFINFREKAPAAASADMYLNAQVELRPDSSLYGYLAVAVPGTVAGLDHALQRYGTLTCQQVMAPAIRLARQGFILTRGDTDIIDSQRSRLCADPLARVRFFRPDGSPLQPGDRLTQPELADTLQMLATQGAQAFYHGALPQATSQALRTHGGIITPQDFADYRISETPPISCHYRGYQFLSSPPPSSGGITLCLLLNILEGYDIAQAGFNSAQSISWMVEAMRYAYQDRNTLLGDPDFVDIPVKRLLSKAYAAEIRQRINTAQPGLAAAPQSNKEKPETTHYSVIDKQGNAVSTTYTLNGRFGALVMAPGGFFLNNEMDDFTIQPGKANLYGLVQGEKNTIAAGKRPLSSMAPTLVLQQERVVMALGSPGGSRIISIILQNALNLIDHGMAPQEAIDAARIHYQGVPDRLYMEQRGLSPDTQKLLRARGYTLEEQTPWGAAEIIVRAPLSASKTAASSGNDAALSGVMRPGHLYAASDARRPAGAAMGY
ncbi:gamma-glutamyltransferase [Edwardsiella ictaluri]|uniref:gamma-glutamyltransferase n=1 Tax=Edwardsiella ictaluri TaxID=67780 RepID=UPI00378441A2